MNASAPDDAADLRANLEAMIRLARAARAKLDQFVKCTRRFA